jgi:hypothetical protein
MITSFGREAALVRLFPDLPLCLNVDGMNTSYYQLRSLRQTRTRSKLSYVPVAASSCHNDASMQ